MKRLEFRIFETYSTKVSLINRQYQKSATWDHQLSSKLLQLNYFCDDWQKSAVFAKKNLTYANGLAKNHNMRDLNRSKV